MSRRSKLVGIVLAVVLIPMMGQACPPQMPLPAPAPVPGPAGPVGPVGPVGPAGASPFALVGNDAVLNGTVFADAFSSNSPLLLQTAGTTRIRIDDVTGNVGVKTGLAPTADLHVFGNFKVQKPDLTATIVIDGEGIDSSFLNQGDLFLNPNSSGDVILANGGGDVGVGTPSPTAALHVVGAENDGTDAALKVRSGTSPFQTTMLIDGNEIDATGGVLGSTGLSLNKNVSGNVILANGGGKVGIRKNNPVTTVHIRHSNGVPTNGLSIEGDDNFRWNIYHSSEETLWLVFENFQKGEFDETTGNYSAVSDRRVKKNIEPVGAVLPGIMQLKPSKYQFREEGDSDPKHFGLIAQDLINVFPEVVTVHDNNADDGGIEGLHLVAYSELVPILTRGIQEQQEIIDRHETTIGELRKILADLTARLERLEAMMDN